MKKPFLRDSSVDTLQSTHPILRFNNVQLSNLVIRNTTDPDTILSKLENILAHMEGMNEKIDHQ